MADGRKSAVSHAFCCLSLQQLIALHTGASHHCSEVWGFPLKRGERSCPTEGWATTQQRTFPFVSLLGVPLPAPALQPRAALPGHPVGLGCSGCGAQGPARAAPLGPVWGYGTGGWPRQPALGSLRQEKVENYRTI